jgi:hypothetical protein
VTSRPGGLAFVLAASAAASGSAQRAAAPRATPYAIAYVFEAREPATHEATVRVRVTGDLGDSINPGNVFPFVVGHLSDSVTVTEADPDAPEPVQRLGAAWVAGR